MRYLQPQPMVFGSTRAYANAWEQTFGKKEEVPKVEDAQRNNRRRVVLASIKKGRK